MTDVWIDPAELDAMSGVIGQQAQRAQDAFAGDLGLRDVALPAHLEWIRAEGTDLATEAAVVTVAYLLNGMDLAVRAEAVRTEQATPTEVAAPTEPPTEMAAPAEGFVLSGSPVATAGSVPTDPQGGGFVLDLVTGLDGVVRTGSGGIDFKALFAMNSGAASAPLAGGTGVYTSHDQIREILTGVRWRDGRPVDDWGSNDHTASAIETDPVTGRPRVRP